jgi:hypothetical protein
MESSLPLRIGEETDETSTFSVLAGPQWMMAIKQENVSALFMQVIAPSCVFQVVFWRPIAFQPFLCQTVDWYPNVFLALPPVAWVKM